MKTIIILFGIIALSYASFSSDMLALHNNARATLGISKLTWSSSLAKTATAWAVQMAKTGDFEHSHQSGKGENIAFGTKNVYTYTKLFNAWLAEKKYFIKGAKFPYCSTTGSYKAVGHYTQIIWAKTTKVGCGMATTSKYNYLVCQYTKPGNYMNQYVY